MRPSISAVAINRRKPGSFIVPPATVSGVAPTTAVACVTGGSISGPMPYFTVAPTAWWPSRTTSIRNVAGFAGLIGPVRVVRRHRHSDAAERLAGLRRHHDDERGRQQQRDGETMELSG